MEEHIAQAAVVAAGNLAFTAMCSRELTPTVVWPRCMHNSQALLGRAPWQKE